MQGTRLEAKPIAGGGHAEVYASVRSFLDIGLANSGSPCVEFRNQEARYEPKLPRTPLFSPLLPNQMSKITLSAARKPCAAPTRRDQNSCELVAKSYGPR
jgi:hypothetical protein